MADSVRSADSMPPPPSTKALGKRKASEMSLTNAKESKLPLSLYRQRVLDEDDFAEAISQIIKRDFFPELYERDKEEALAAKLATGDIATPGWTLPSTNRHSIITPTPYRKGIAATPSETPYAREGDFQTPRSPRSIARDAKKTEEMPYDDSLSLSSFLDRYTSEDNASFANILNRQNADRRVKYSWAYESERLANEKERQQRKAREALVEGIRLAIEASETGEVNLIEGVEAGRPGGRLVLEPGRTSIIGDRASIEAAKQRQIGIGRTDQLLITGPEGGEGKIEVQGNASKPPELAERVEEGSGVEVPAGTVEAWMHTARNGFFFPPDANESLAAKIKVKIKPLLEELSAAERLGMGEPKAIVHGNTRLPLQGGLADSEGSVPPSPSSSNIAAAISGTPYPGRDPMTPRVGGYGFVSANPSPNPAELGKQGLQRLITRGRLASTPVALRGDDDDRPSNHQPFKIPPTPRREELALRMAGDASRSLKARHGGRLSLPTLGPRIRTTSDRGGHSRDPTTPRANDDMLSPAAKTLLGRTGEGRRRTGAGGTRGEASSSALTPNAFKGRQMDRESRARVQNKSWSTTPGGSA